ncbi:unnamed protein product [Coregonus sp. 'balchen']|nr:unnamed protein product [Coregonus sp. 'balchen']
MPHIGLLALFQEAPHPQDNSDISASGDTYATASQWVSSDIFVVVLLLVLLVLRAVCWVVRNNRTQRTTAEYERDDLIGSKKLTEIEIISAGDGPERDTQAKCTLKIKTDQRHATQLVEILVGREGAGPGNPLAPLTSVTLPTVVSPTDMMASPASASLPVPTENMPKNQSVPAHSPDTCAHAQDNKSPSILPQHS